MNVPRTVALCLLILAASAVGCTRRGVEAGVPQQDSAQGAVDVLNHRWRLLMLKGSPPQPGWGAITLEFRNQWALGFGGCNSYYGRYEITGGSLRFADLSRTVRGCREPEGTNEQERAYLDALAEVVHYSIAGGMLHLYDAAGAILLVYEHHTEEESAVLRQRGR